MSGICVSTKTYLGRWKAWSDDSLRWEAGPKIPLWRPFRSFEQLRGQGFQSDLRDVSVAIWPSTKQGKHVQFEVHGDSEHQTESYQTLKESSRLILPWLGATPHFTTLHTSFLIPDVADMWLKCYHNLLASVCSGVARSRCTGCQWCQAYGRSRGRVDSFRRERAPSVSCLPLLMIELSSKTLRRMVDMVLCRLNFLV